MVQLIIYLAWLALVGVLTFNDFFNDLSNQLKKKNKDENNHKRKDE